MPMRQEIPGSVMSVVAYLIAESETDTRLDSLIMYAQVPGDPPMGSKQVPALARLRGHPTLLESPQSWFPANRSRVFRVY